MVIPRRHLWEGGGMKPIITVLLQREQETAPLVTFATTNLKVR